MEKLDFAIIASKRDAAGMNIAANLQKIQKFPSSIGGSTVDVLFVEKDLIYCENVDDDIEADTFIFASKHVSEAKVHSLTIHSIGNWGAAERGGRDRTLVRCPAALIKACFQLLAEKAADAGLDYEVVQEATHHGPFLKKPAMFIEIGSDEERWKDDAAGKIIAGTIIEAISRLGSCEVKAAAGLGGLHYAANFRKVMLSKDVAVSYICPKHSLGLLDAEMLRQAMQSSVPSADSVILDWKGLGKEKERIARLLQSIGVTCRRTSEF